jgi:hypothetical protein
MMDGMESVDLPEGPVLQTLQFMVETQVKGAFLAGSVRDGESCHRLSGTADLHICVVPRICPLLQTSRHAVSRFGSSSLRLCSSLLFAFLAFPFPAFHLSEVFRLILVINLVDGWMVRGALDGQGFLFWLVFLFSLPLVDQEISVTEGGRGFDGLEEMVERVGKGEIVFEIAPCQFEQVIAGQTVFFHGMRLLNLA